MKEKPKRINIKIIKKKKKDNINAEKDEIKIWAGKS